MDTTIGMSIEIAAEKARYDAACKQMLAEKMILAWIMKSTMKEFAAVPVKTIADECIVGTPQIAQIPLLPDETNAPRIPGTGVEDVSLTEGSITYDIQFRAVHPETGEPVGLIINIEAQNDFYPGYPLMKRAVYYCSRMISSQYGVEFTNSHYEKIKKVYSVWICMNPPKNRENTITSYSFAENHLVGAVQEKPENYDLMTAIMICLGRSADGTDSALLRLLDVLLSEETDAATKKQILSADFDIPMTQKMERGMNAMCNLSDGVFQRGMEKGIEKGIEKGMEKGILEGRQQGIEQNVISSIRNVMDSLGVSLEQAMDILKIPSEKREKYSKLLTEA